MFWEWDVWGRFTFTVDGGQRHGVRCAVSHFAPDHCAVSLCTPEKSAVQKLSLVVIIMVIMFYFSA